MPLVLLGCAAAQYPLEVGLVPNDQYTASPAPAPYGAQGWKTGRSTFFDGSDAFKNAYLARSATSVHEASAVSTHRKSAFMQSKMLLCAACEQV